MSKHHEGTIVQGTDVQGSAPSNGLECMRSINSSVLNAKCNTQSLEDEIANKGHKYNR